MEDNRGIRVGLVLTAKEVSLFTSKMISPSLAVGTRKKKHLITYQVNVSVCPHIDDKNECSTYDKRPLMCKAFPYVSGGFSAKCTALSYRKVGGVYYDSVPSESQVEAHAKLDRYMRNRFRKYFTKGIQVWDYDLATRSWVFRVQHSEYPQEML